MKNYSLLFLAFLFFATPAFAEEPQDEVYELSLLKDGLISGAGLLLFGTSLLLDHFIAQAPGSEVALDINNVNAFDRWAATGYNPTLDKACDVLAFGLLAMPSLLFIKKDIGEILTIGVMYSEAILLATGVKEIVKNSIIRYRPYNYFDNPHEDHFAEDSANSFFSGHTTYVFTSAAFLTKVFSDYNPDSPWKYAVGIGSYSVAATVGILRIASGNHFPSDVLLGAASGTLIGFFVPFLHKINEDESVALAISSDGNQGMSFSVKYTFQ